MSAVLAPPRLTPEEFLRLPSDETAGFELVDGELEENPLSVQSNLLGGRVFNRICNWAESGQGGDAFPQDSPFRCFADDPELFRKPDVAYVGPGRLSDDQYREDGYCSVVPDFVVEVLSPNDLASRINTKVGEWLDAGVRLVWVVDPDTKTVLEYTPAGPMRRYRNSDVLSGGDVLPSFSLPLADLFRRTGPVVKPYTAEEFRNVSAKQLAVRLARRPGTEELIP